MNTWFTVDGVSMQWIDTSPSNRVSHCDVCDIRVESQERRLRVDDGKGPARKGGRGKQHSYLCEQCGGRRTG